MNLESEPKVRLCFVFVPDVERWESHVQQTLPFYRLTHTHFPLQPQKSFSCELPMMKSLFTSQQEVS